MFSLTLREVLKSYVPPNDLKLQLWYLDVVGPRKSVREFFDFISTNGHKYGLLLNPAKCEVYWPSGDPDFPEFPKEICRLKEGVTLLGSPLWGSKEFMASEVDAVIDKALEMQVRILDLDNT